MIVDTVDNADCYKGTHPVLKEALEFMKKTDLKSLKPGRNEIAGARLYAIAIEDKAKAKSECMLEIHKNYADVQIVLDGIEEMGWKPTTACTDPAGPYDATKDLQFFKDKADFFVPVRQGMFAVFFPGDAHQPMVGKGRIRKVVLKVALA